MDTGYSTVDVVPGGRPGRVPDPVAGCTLELEPRWLSTLRVEAVEKRLSKRPVLTNTEPCVFVRSSPMTARMFLLNACSKTKRLKRSIVRLLLPTRYLRQRGFRSLSHSRVGCNPFVPHPKFVTALSAVTGLWTVSGSSIGSCCEHGSMHHFPLLPRGKCRHLLGLS